MRQQFTRLASLAIVATVAIGLAGCSTGTGGDAPDDETLSIGLAVKTLSGNPVWQGVVAGAQAAADDIGAELTVVSGTSDNDVTGQITKIQDLITQDVDILIVAAAGGEQTQPVLQQALDAGIEVVLIDTAIEGLADKTSLITSDQEAGSTAVNQLIVDELGADAEGAEYGLLDFAGNPTIDARLNAARAVFDAAGMVEVASLPGNCDRATALDSTTDMLTAHPNIRAIFGACGNGAVGAAQAVQNAGLDVLVTGFDGITDEFTGIEQGTILGSILQDFLAIGGESVKAGVAGHDGETLDPIIYVPGILITKDNVGDNTPAG